MPKHRSKTDSQDRGRSSARRKTEAVLRLLRGEDLDTLSREFAREHSDRLWKQLVLVPSDSGELRAPGRKDAILAFCLAVAAAVLIKEGVGQ